MFLLLLVGAVRNVSQLIVKTQVMRNSPSKSPPNTPSFDIYIKGAKLVEVDKYKYLGAIIDSQFSFKPHVSK